MMTVRRCRGNSQEAVYSWVSNPGRPHLGVELNHHSSCSTGAACLSRDLSPTDAATGVMEVYVQTTLSGEACSSQNCTPCSVLRRSHARSATSAPRESQPVAKPPKRNADRGVPQPTRPWSVSELKLQGRSSTQPPQSHSLSSLDNCVPESSAVTSATSWPNTSSVDISRTSR